MRGERRPAGAGVGVDHLSEEDALPHGVTDIYYIYTRYAIARDVKTTGRYLHYLHFTIRVPISPVTRGTGRVPTCWTR